MHNRYLSSTSRLLCCTEVFIAKTKITDIPPPFSINSLIQSSLRELPRYQVGSPSPNSFVDNPLPKYLYLLPPSYSYTKSSPRKFSSIWNQCILLPGCKAVTGPVSFPFLNHERHVPAHAVRGMKLSICSLYSLVAIGLGEIAVIPSV